MRELWIAVALAGFASSCGFITAGAASATASEGSASNAPAAITGFAVESAKAEPAHIRFTLADAESDSVEVELLYDAPDPDGSDPLEAVQGARLEHVRPLGGGPELSNPMVLDASPEGKLHTFEWMFTQEPSVPDAGGWTPDVLVYARIAGGVQVLTPGANAARLGLGNDPPVIVDADEDGFADATLPTGEVVGLVLVSLLVSDTSEDQVGIAVEYALADGLDLDAGELPDASAFLPATEAGAGVGSIAATMGGTSVDFLWDPLADLEQTEHDVVFRITPDDRTLDEHGNSIGIGATVLTRVFRVDNNAAPIVQFDSGALLANQDERRGIPIPYRVIDVESDLVEVIWQWWREGETFPELPGDGAALDAILADKKLRREHHICSAYAPKPQGRVVPIDATSVRLPELAQGASALAREIEGATLEILRPPTLLEPVAATWSANPLEAPIAALPVGTGLTALVLDAPGGFGRLRELELATGTIVRELGPLGAGAPTAMAFERGGAAVLVASDLGATWRIERIELASGVATELYASGPSDEPSPVRGLASLGTQTAVLTAGSTLSMLDYRDPLAPRLATVLEGLATPWGVAVDLLNESRIFVAERDAPTALGTGRVLSVALDTHAGSPVVARTKDLAPASLERPEALALAQRGTRLFVVTRAGTAQRIVGLGLGAKEANESFPIGQEQRADVASVASGPDGLLLACIPSQGELLVAGGVEQRRAVSGYQASTQRVVVQPAFAPQPRAGRSWRLEPAQRVRSAPTGVVRTFVWDANADLGHGSAFLRAFARDTEAGLAEPGVAPKRVRSALDVPPLELGGPAVIDFPLSVAVADLDRDGDQDLVSANAFSNNLTVFFQDAPGSFDPALLELGGPGITDNPQSVAAADLDGDGDQDLVSANYPSDRLRVFFQDAPGSFAGPSLVVGGPNTIDGPSSVAAGDLDGDGDQDLVCANQQGNTLRIFYQSGPGSFVVGHKLGGPSTTDHPSSVAVADLDGDGDVDLVSANSSSGTLTVFFRAPVGFAPPFVLDVFGLGLPGGGTPVSVTAADLDGDGDQDLVSANQYPASAHPGSLTVFFQVGPGSFAPTPVELTGSGFIPTSVEAADLDGDLDLDLVSANNNPVGAERKLTVFFQNLPGSFSPSPLQVGESTLGPASVAAGDLDGDGDQDLVSANPESDNLTVFFQDAQGSFDPAPLAVGESTSNVSSVAAADLDGDLDLDLASASSVGNLTVFFQSLPGSFAPSPLELGGSTLFPDSVTAGDLDGDGDQDLATANGFAANLTVFFQKAPGSFARNPLVLQLPGGSRPSSLATADLDGDGGLDLVSANEGNDTLTVFFQTGPESFDRSALALGGSAIMDFPHQVVAADMDGDGDGDLVSAGSTLTIFFQEAPGSFDRSPLVLGGPGITDAPLSVEAADLDGDGDLDLVSANIDCINNNCTFTVTVFLQSAPGSFDRSLLVFGGPVVTRVRAVDVDGDLDLDLVAGTGGKLSIFFQGAPGRFSAVPLDLAVRGRISLAVDVDGDGDQDLISDFGGGPGGLQILFGSHR